MLTSFDPYLQQAVGEHLLVRHKVDDILARLVACQCENKDHTPPPDRAIVENLSSLAKDLREHFEQEEQGGYMEEALAHAPHLAGQARFLQHQHVALLRDLEKLIAAARQMQNAASCCNWLRTQFPAFRQRMCAHEYAENKLLQRAFNVDFALED